jgi:N-acetylmuramoyl-L-alanine amidase
MRLQATAALAGFLALSALAPSPAHAQGVKTLYTDALRHERIVRDASATADQMRRVVAEYERIVRRYPASGYSDNALWQAGNLALLAYQRFGDDADRRTATRLLKQLRSGYPASAFAAQAEAVLANAKPPAPPATPPPAPAAVQPAAARPGPAVAATAGALPMLRDIHRTALPDGVRVTIDLDAEVAYYEESLEHPRRVFFDLKGVRAVPALQDVSLKFADDIVKEIRLGRHPLNTTRVVLDMEGTEGYSVYSLYNPYRLVVDFRRPAATRPIDPIPVNAAPPTPLPAVALPADPEPIAIDPIVPPLRTNRTPPAVLPVPALPAANSNGKYSLARQLGLGVSRIVIDAGHGGHDPGAHGSGVVEAELTLDVALRLQKLLEKQPGVEVVMTRDTDVFIPLQERTAIANREGADLFLSIHANASRNPHAHGVETYFLNFATNPEAEAVAARENSASGQAMHALPDIVKAIALNNKIDESHDFASIVQQSMVRRLVARNKQLKDLGVKQAPFVVLIGAGMPSVLAEISFVTNKQEGQLLKTGAYRQQIAEALQDAVLRYQQSLKNRKNIAAKGTRPE